MKKINCDEKVYRFITDFIRDNGYAPTVREICKGCGIKSTATPYQVMNRLAERGLIKKTGNRNRAVSIANQSPTVNVPLIGTVAAGEPIFAAENYEDFYNIPGNFFKGDDLFMLNVKGSSMINIGMFDGDKVVVRKQDTAENGDIVVALVEDSATVKRFFKRGNKIYLHPENDDMQDFVFDNVQILGKVIGLMRNI